MHETEVGFNFEYIDLFDESLNYELEDFLNDEVEIIEEDKKIEKLNNKFTFEDNPSELSETAWKISRISIKLNELIDEVNKLKEIEK